MTAEELALISNSLGQQVPLQPDALNPMEAPSGEGGSGIFPALAGGGYEGGDWRNAKIGPNMQMVLGLGGSAVGGNTGIAPIGNVVAGAVNQKALQNAYHQKNKNQKTQAQQIAEALGGATAAGKVSPKGDLGGADSINITSDGITYKYPNPTNAPQTNQSLESQPNGTSSTAVGAAPAPPVTPGESPAGSAQVPLAGAPTVNTPRDFSSFFRPLQG